jgi:hypothetical protein
MSVAAGAGTDTPARPGRDGFVAMSREGAWRGGQPRHAPKELHVIANTFSIP